MTLITLTTDWNNDDFYIGAIKGLLYSKCSDAKVIDITHKIESHKYTQAAFVLRNAFHHFPAGTIHIVGINSEPTNEFPAICIKIKEQYFIGAASGIFSLMFSEEPEMIVEIEEKNDIINSSFPELSIFANAAAKIANGIDITTLGKALKEGYRHVQFMPAYDEFDITGNIVYIDSYHNVFTNISKPLFEQVAQNRKYTISIKSDNYKVTQLSTNYNQVDVGEILALFNSLDLLEIAMRNGHLAKLLDIRINSPVTIKFR